MSALQQNDQLWRLHSLCYLPIIHFRRIACSNFVPSARRFCAGSSSSSSSFPSLLSFHGGPERSKRLVSNFEPDDRRTLSVSEIVDTDENRLLFDINIAVMLAGFAFEAYNTPSDSARTHETDPFECKTIFLSEQFLREVYDGRLFINLRSGSQLPGLDLWGTSDPYVILRIGECVVRSKTIWATTEPVWNEQFKVNVKNPSMQYLQVAAWDANLVTDHRRLGNSGVNLELFSDGEKHAVKVELEGMGGGGILNMEVQYKRFEEIDVANKGWTFPLLSDFLHGKGLEDIFKSTFGFETLTVRDFLQSVLGSVEQEMNAITYENREGSLAADLQGSTEHYGANSVAMRGIDAESGSANEESKQILHTMKRLESEDQLDDKEFEGDFLRTLGEHISQTIGVNVDKLGIPVLDKVSWNAFDVIKNLGLESKNKADSQLVEEGFALATNNENSSSDEPALVEDSSQSVEDLQKASLLLLKQTEETLKSWAVLASSLTSGTDSSKSLTDKTTAVIKETAPSVSPGDATVISSLTSSEKVRAMEELEELRKMFGKAESAMEAWAVLASSLGHKSFVKSAFEKLCFLDNHKTDTQVALWRDAQHRRLVVAFRGTEQVKWKDLKTDLMLLPVSFNPERFGGKFKEEAMVHGGFLNAYDSVRNRLMSLVKAATGTSGKEEIEHPWQVYVTGHSLGGALATLFALELSTSQLSRRGYLKVTMYNFGSPRVGNKKFADQYNEVVKDSWRVVNHRDIIPTVPRLMGYCHVAQPIYLTAGDVEDATVNMELVEDGYHGDVIGEATPDFLLEEFMKGEKRLIERLLQTEIAMISAIRDGSALMQHMEDFYYISLLETVSQRFRSR